MAWTAVLRKSMSDLMLNGTTKTSLASALSTIRNAIEKDNPESYTKVEKYLRSVYISANRMSLKQYQRQKDKALEDMRETYDEEGELTDDQETALQHIVPVYTKRQLSFEAQELLDLKIRESVNLIKLNREQSINRTLQRFQGWATALPPNANLPKTFMQAKRESR
jgi:hypothetical protein